MDNGGFLDGLPLGSVKKAWYRNKLGTVFSLVRLIYNNSVYIFDGQDHSGGSGGGAEGGGGDIDDENGSVTTDQEMLTWTFIAPKNRFSIEELTQGTFAESMETLAQECEEEPVPAWEEFSAFFGSNAETVDQVFAMATRAAIKGIPIMLVPAKNVATFPDFLRWIISISGDAGKLPASMFIAENDPEKLEVHVDVYIPAEEGGDIAGFKLLTPSVRPETDALTVFQDGDKGIYYNDNDGALTKPCLFFTAPMCPLFPVYYAGYDTILYVYEETSDNLGLGMTLQPGWYAINSTTYAMTAFDLEQTPIVMMLGDVTPNAKNDPYIETFIEPIFGVPDRLFAPLTFIFRV